MANHQRKIEEEEEDAVYDVDEIVDERQVSIWYKFVFAVCRISTTRTAAEVVLSFKTVSDGFRNNPRPAKNTFVSYLYVFLVK